MNKNIQIIILTIAILLIGGAIYAIKYYDPKAPEYSKEVNTGISDWKTYTGSGFELQYPKDWVIEESEGNVTRIINPEHPGKADTGVPSEEIYIGVYTDSSPCKNTEWETGIADTFIKTMCINGKSELIVIMKAFDVKTQELEDKIMLSFKLTSSTSTPATQSVKSSSIQVISPKSGDKLVIGKTYDVKWSNYSGQENLNIVLVGKKSSAVITSTLKAANVGTYTMTVPAVDISDTYKVEVYPAGGRELVGRSGEFTITN